MLSGRGALHCDTLQVHAYRFQDIVEHGGLTLSAKQFVDNFFWSYFWDQMVQQLNLCTSVCCSPLSKLPALSQRITGHKLQLLL